MRSVPKSRAGIVGFYQIRADRWVERAQQLNIDPEHAAEVQELTHQAVQARLRQRAAILAARSATLHYNNLVRQLGRKGASLLKKLQVQASSDESVYTHALI